MMPAKRNEGKLLVVVQTERRVANCPLLDLLSLVLMEELRSEHNSCRKVMVAGILSSVTSKAWEVA
jgi:hypothetical protein